MIDRDAEIAKMVDEYLASTRRGGVPVSDAKSAAGMRFARRGMGRTAEEFPTATEDYVLRVDETPAEDVERRGVIGTETE